MTDILKREIEEIEVDLDAPEPLSKKQKRLQKKGKLELSQKKKDKARKAIADDSDLRGDDVPATAETASGNEGDDGQNDSAEPVKSGKSGRSDFSAWVGNLSFDTTKEDLKRFIVSKCESVTDDSITRINMPKSTQGRNKIKGFAYVDVSTQDELDELIGLSETFLNSRNLLIKNAKSFEGRPDVATSNQKNPPSRILFVGNLPFDSTDETLETHFQHCGEIVKIRMATFEDTGNCKGFAFVDFLKEESATAALKDKRCKKINGRMLRMEYGEDRSKRRAHQSTDREAPRAAPVRGPRPVDSLAIANQVLDSMPDKHTTSWDRHKRDYRDSRPRQAKDMKPGLALATAQRAKPSIVESTGKKTKF